MTRGRGARSGKGLLEAYRQLEAEIERRFDGRLRAGAFREAVTRLVAWYGPRWFGETAAAIDDKPPLLEDPLAREEELVAAVAPWVKPPALAFTTGHGIMASALGIERVVGPDDALRRIGLPLFGLTSLGTSVADLPAKLDAKTVVCLDYLRCQANEGAVLSFLTEVTGRMAPGTRLVIADDLSFQDDAVENLVALDYEILDLKSVARRRLVLVHAER